MNSSSPFIPGDKYFFPSDLVAECYGRVGEAAVPGHADLHADRLGEEVPHAVGDLGHHHREAHRQ